MSTAIVMLIASSKLPINALTVALPHKRMIKGFSYIVFANLMSRGSGAETENSL